MGRVLICDVCRKPTKRIAAKVHLILLNGQTYAASDYSHHADVGECCVEAFTTQTVKWKGRKKQARTQAKVTANA